MCRSPTKLSENGPFPDCPPSTLEHSVTLNQQRSNLDSPAADIEAGRRTMLGGIIWFCLHNKLVMTLLVLAIMTWGVMVAPFDWELGGLPRDRSPSMPFPTSARTNKSSSPNGWDARRKTWKIRSAIR